MDYFAEQRKKREDEEKENKHQAEVLIEYYREGKQYLEIAKFNIREIDRTKFRARLHPDENYYVFMEPENFRKIIDMAGDRGKAIRSLFLTLRGERKKKVFVDINKI